MHEEPDATSRVVLPTVFDDASVAELGPGLRALAADPAQDRIVLDARDVKAMGSAALGLLAALGLVARRRGASVEVVNCDERLRGLLRVARLPASTAECPEPDPSSDWAPWWRCAAANA